MSLLKVLQDSPEQLISPDENVKNSALESVKAHFDPIVGDYSIFDEIHIEGLDADQVWGQVQMVVDGALEKLMSNELLDDEGGIESAGTSQSEEEGFEDLAEDSELESQEDGSENENDEEESDNETFVDPENLVDDFEESDMEMGEYRSAEEQDEDEEEDANEEAEEGGESDGHGLNDEIFKLEEYQKQVLDLEKDDDDDEFIDFGVSHLGDGDEEEEEEELDADVDAKYEDFFAPPKRAKKTSKPKKTVHFDEATNEEQEFGEEDEEDEEAIENMMENTRKDLFASDEESENEEDEENLSTFEKQQREIMKQIQQLEAENVGEKKWEVKGEVKARDRPTDSLLESELDFERNTKAAPIITEEVTNSLEDVIKKRIQDGNFDDLPRRLPDLLPEFRPSRSVEVQETKSSKSLAELYEDDYVKANNPDAYTDAEAEKLSGAHKEIEELFNSLNHKLDALSSWSYTPKRAKPQISIVSEAAAISMEDAQPTAMATESMLAPQEIYQTSVDGKREVVGRDGVPVAKREMDKDERKRERRRQKAKRAKHLKARDELQRSKATKEGSRANVMETLKKGNVTIIGKHGEKRDTSGKMIKEKAKILGSNMKL